MHNYYYKPKSILSFDREISIRYKQRCGLESNYDINSLIINPYTHKPLPLSYIPTTFVNPTKILFHNITVEYRPGKKNQNADSLSRMNSLWNSMNNWAETPRT